MPKVISWGCGVQSTALAVMSALGHLPRVDAVITSDTEWETARTYETREFYTRFLEAHGIPVYIVSGGNVRIEGAQEHIHIPFWTNAGGPLQRQCTEHFKIVPQKRFLRELYNLPKIPAKHVIEQWIGFSLDEWQRMKHSRVQFIKNTWPLIDNRITRNDCIDYFNTYNLPVPMKSSCIGCPYRLPSEFMNLEQSELSDAVSFDEENRHNPLAERSGSTANELYVYRYGPRLALKDADLERDMRRERQAKQLPLICEEGYCMV